MGQISVRLANGELQPMSFPDDWSQDQVKDAIYKHFPDQTPANQSEIASSPLNPKSAEVQEEPQAEQTGFKGIMNETAEMLQGALKGGIGYIEGIPDEWKGIKQEFKEHPLKETAHAAGQLSVRLAENLKSIANLGLSGLTPISELGGMPEGAKPFQYQIPENTGLQKALGLQSNKKGDKLIKSAVDIAALGTGLGSLLKGGAKFLNKTLPIGAETIRRNLMEEAIIKAAKEHGAAEADVKALQESLAESFSKEHKSKIGPVTPSGQRIEANVKEGLIEKLEPSANIPEKKVGELGIAPDKDKMMSKLKDAKEEATKALSTALKAKEEHPLKAGQIISKHLDKLHDAAAALYNKVEKGYEGIDIPIDNTVKINEEAANLHKLIEEDLASGESLAPGYGSGTSEQKALEAKIKSLEGQTVKASDVYDVQRTLQNRAKKARTASFVPGLDKIERTRLQKLAAKHEQAAINLSEKLEHLGDPETQAMLKEANEGWRTYKDISRSKVGKSILRNEGKIPADTMTKITGTGKGNEHLRKLVESDPELSLYILGQKFSKPSKHGELLEGNNTVDAYIKRSSDVQDKMTKLKVALKNMSEGKGEYKEARAEYKALEDSINNTAKEQKLRAESQEEIKRLSAQRKSHLEASKAIDEKIKIAEAKGENTAKLKEDKARHIREYNNSGTRLDKLKSRVYKAVGGKIGYDVLFKEYNKD